MTNLTADTIRAFWSVFLGAKIASDGSVPGFDRWWKDAHPDLHKIGMDLAYGAAHLVEQGASMDDTVATNVAAFKRSVQAFRAPTPEPANPQDVSALVASLGRALKW